MVQTLRKDRIDPDACEKKKGICYEKSVTFDLKKTSMRFTGIGATPDDLRIPVCVFRTALEAAGDDFRKNVAIARFLVKNKIEYVIASNVSREEHSEDIIFIIAKQRFGEGNFALSALFSERVPCPRCGTWLKTAVLTPDCKVSCIINNDYNRSALRRNYNNGVL